MRTRAVRLIGVIAALTAGCTGSVRHLRPFAGTEAVDCDADRTALLELTYLGSGGFAMHWNDHTILTAPFYSNPSLFRVGLGFPIAPDIRLIKAHLPPVDDAEAILVGHAHYDHLMDAVWVAEQRAPHAVLYGNQTMAHILAARPALRGRVIAMDAAAGDWRAPGRWYYVANGSIRFMALRSAHAPHFLGIKLFGGSIDVDQEQLPRTAYGWKEGQTFAFLIDFLDASGAVRIRLHYQDAATTAPAGFPPPLADIDSAPIDVAILCVASFAQVDDYPEAIVRRLQPHTVVLGHWENFFRSPEASLEAVPLTDTRAFTNRLIRALPEGASWHTPRPGATVRVCAAP